MTKTNEEWVEEFQNKDHIITSDGGLYVAIDAHWLRNLLTTKDQEKEAAVRVIQSELDQPDALTK